MGFRTTVGLKRPWTVEAKRVWYGMFADPYYRADTLNSNFRHFEQAAEGRRNQIRISHFERDFGEFMTCLHLRDCI
jgi:hypothetical protein